MDDLIRQILFYDDLAPEERRADDDALDDALDGNADLARAVRRWQAVRQRTGERFREDLPERRLLVLHALATGPAPREALSDAERRKLEDARPQVEAALAEHPALEDVIEQIRRERDAFEAAWDRHAGATTPSNDVAASSNSDSSRSGAPRSGAPRSGAPRSRRPRAADRPAAAPGGAGSAPKRRLVQRWGWRVAAAVALVAFGAMLFFVLQRDLSTVTVTAAQGEEPRTVTLADGSTVRLMPGATLSYVDPESDAALDRQATLEAGRAFFDIVHEQNGFTVETPTARVTVMGTRFGVRTEEKSTRVVLASGRVALTSRGAGGAPVTLRPGQASRVAAGARPATPTRVENLSEALAWTGTFFFRDTPAEDLARQIAAHYDQAVRVAPALQKKKVTGTFDRDRPLRETLSTVAAALDAQLAPLPDGYLIAPSSGP